MTLPIELVWADVPEIACKGLCQDSCGPIGASPVEIRLLRDRGIELENVVDALFNVAIAKQEPQDCPALVDGQCSVYEVRPTICRLWGVAEEMPCPYGCVPEGGLIDRATGHHLLQRSMQVGQLDSRRDRRRRR